MFEWNEAIQKIIYWIEEHLTEIPPCLNYQDKSDILRTTVPTVFTRSLE